MKAVILAAGKGTRMGELTQQVPKPMLLVQGRPILEHIVRGLAGVGVKEICVVTGWRADVIRDHFGDGTGFGVPVCYVRQTVQDGTGRAPELAKEFVGQDPFLLTYGDILVKPDTYASVRARYSEDQFSALLTVTRGEDVTKGGACFFDENFCLRRLVEKPGTEDVEVLRREGWFQPGAPVWYNAGIYIFEPVIFDYTARLRPSSRGEYELTDALCAMLADGHRIAGLRIQGRWVDVRDPEVLAELE